MSLTDELLQQLFEQCSRYNELPHNFDDTLIDKLADSITFEENSLILLRHLTETLDFETCRHVPIQIVIRLLDAAVLKNHMLDDQILANFVQKSEVLLSQNRPLKLWSDLFTFYSRPQVFESRKVDLWMETIRWAISEIDKPMTSVFLRRTYAQFISKLTPEDARRLMVISGFVEIFTRRLLDTENPDCVLMADVPTRIMERYASALDPTECLAVTDAVRNSQRTGEKSLKLCTQLKVLYNNLAIPVSPGSWRSEANRVDFLCLMLELPNYEEACRGLTSPIGATSREESDAKNIETLLEFLLHSPACNLSHRTRVLGLFTDKQVSDFVEQLKVEVHFETIVRIADVTKLMPKLYRRVTDAQMASIFVAMGHRVLESSSTLKQLAKLAGPDVFKKPEYAEVAQRLRVSLIDIIRTSNRTEWEQIDTALEIMYEFPTFLPDHADLLELARTSQRSPYVFTTALRILRDHFGGIPQEYIQLTLLILGDPAPKELVLDYLISPEMFEMLTPEDIWEYLDASLSDNGTEIRKKALALAERALQKPSLRDRTTQILDEYKNDHQIGRDVRRIIHLDQVETANNSVSILQEMLASLQVGPAENNVMDCY